jgi:hypothetical protein
MIKRFLSFVSKESLGASKINSRPSKYVTESINGTFKYSPGDVYEFWISPNLVTIASFVSSTVNKTLLPPITSTTSAITIIVDIRFIF